MPIPLIDLFAGPGGLNEGFSRLRSARGGAVFRTVLSVECEEWAHRTLELRALYRHLADAGETGDYLRYLRNEITREKLFEEAGAAAKCASAEAMLATLGESESGDREIEERIATALGDRRGDFVLIGGPPCQAYSLVGRARRTNDEKFEDDHKHYLYRQYLRIVRKFRPAAFVMENVPGLLSAKNRGQQMFELICSDLRAAGYDLHPINPVESGGPSADDPRRFVVRAEEFGVPQSRARVFVLGLRRDLHLRPASLVRAAGDPVTVAEALGDLPRIRSRLSKDFDCAVNWRKAIHGLKDHSMADLEDGFRRELLRRLEIVPLSYPLGQRFVERDNGGPARLAEWYLHGDCGMVINHNSRGHMGADLMRYFFWSEYAAHYGRSPSLHDVPKFLRPNHGNVTGDLVDLPFADRFRVQLGTRPSTTIVSHISKDGHYYIHYEPKQCRSLSVREAARLQTFPDNYFFEGAATDQYRQVGNAVPPYLAMQIAGVVSAVLAGRPKPAASAAAAHG
jgi:DNA (cytosine-5)-methyltransferase 1